MNCSECGARMWVKNQTTDYNYLRVCAIAYNGGSYVNVKSEPPKEDET